MGLRTASVRHPNAVVMAPALTEAGQSKSFTLPPSPISNLSRNGEYLNKNANQMCKTDLKLNGQINVTANNYLSDCLSLITKTKVGSNCRKVQASDSSSQVSIIMNTSPTLMGDQNNTMGLQKPGIDAISLLKDKSTINNDVEQLLNNLSALPETGVDLTQNVDDLMQAWNVANMESSNVQRGGETETEPIFPIAFERDLFSDVDMMNMCGADEDNLSQSQVKEARAKETLEDLYKKQIKLERRKDFILRKIRKLQLKRMGHHVSGEIAGLYEYVQRTLLNREKDSTTSIDVIEESTSIEPPQPQPIGTITIQNLIRKLHLSSLQQSSYVSRSKHIAKYDQKYFGSGSQDTPKNPPSGSLCLPRFPVETRDELERVAGTLQTQLNVVETQIDSDATASSSGAESCDEMQTYNNSHQNFMSISKRAAWRYANERAQVASRWTWLQAQISDLEYRIRQYNDLHRQIRACKGPVNLGEPNPLPHRSASNSPMSPSAVNGYRGQLPGATGKFVDDLANGVVTSTMVSSSGCSRTRPLHRPTFKKRKLLQTTGLHTVSKKANRPSNIRCGCVPSVVPCALCTGRTDPTFPRDCPEQMTIPERIALLDPGYHPVLSFPDDVSQSIHLEAIMKLYDWQQKCTKLNVKTFKTLSKTDRIEKLSPGIESRPKKSEYRKKYNNKFLKNDLKGKLGRGRRPFRGIRIKKRHTSLNMLGPEMDELDMDEYRGDESPSSLSHIQVVPYRRNRSVDSYDIDNIVIPYSVAASTRVEKLQYKEILTPKWRVVDSDFPGNYDFKNNGIVRRTSEDSDVEDTSEEIITNRHEKCEHEEKKKFLSYIKFPLTVARPRANRRTDSRAESSGANTPDPMSPHMAENSAEAASGSPLTSPPATPVSMLTTDDSSTMQSQNALRRRTISQSRWAAHNREETRCVTPDYVEAVAPYESRVFPLPEDVYDKMLKLMPEGHLFPSLLNKQLSRDSDVTDSRADTPISDSTESAIAEEDPNDPEWVDVERVRDRTKR